MRAAAVSSERREFGSASEEKIFSFQLDDFPRIQRLREAILNAQSAVAQESSRLLTELLRAKRV